MIDDRNFSSSVCRSPSNCQGNCQCGANIDGWKVKVLDSRTMRGKASSNLSGMEGRPGASSKTKSYDIPKPTMDGYNIV